ncbi:hypothetical protein [Streptomyces spiralis]|uniref:hypothetical protein n=1 Tax=Streptomyces spiralis TaxID=66376 RepID=UPI0036A00264
MSRSPRGTAAAAGIVRSGLTLTARSAAPGTPDHDAQRLLAAWAAAEGTRPTAVPPRPAAAGDTPE